MFKLLILALSSLILLSAGMPSFFSASAGSIHTYNANEAYLTPEGQSVNEVIDFFTRTERIEKCCKQCYPIPPNRPCPTICEFIPCKLQKICCPDPRLKIAVPKFCKYVKCWIGV